MNVRSRTSKTGYCTRTRSREQLEAAPTRLHKIMGGSAKWSVVRVSVLTKHQEVDCVNDIV